MKETTGNKRPTGEPSPPSNSRKNARGGGDGHLADGKLKNSSPPAAREIGVAVQIEPLLLRKDEAARVLGMSARTFDDLLIAGLIGKVAIGGLVLFDVAELREFVRQVRRDGLSRSQIENLIEENKANRQSPASG